MEKEFIPYEQAWELKELGFDEMCLACWSTTRKIPPYLWFGGIEDDGDGFCNTADSAVAAPLYQQAFRWFREKHNLDSIIQPTYSPQYQYRMFRTGGKTKVQIYGDYMGKEFKNYEEAELECLKKLIEIVKNKQQ